MCAVRVVTRSAGAIPRRASSRRTRKEGVDSNERSSGGGWVSSEVPINRRCDTKSKRCRWLRDVAESTQVQSSVFKKTHRRCIRAQPMLSGRERPLHEPRSRPRAIKTGKLLTAVHILKIPGFGGRSSAHFNIYYAMCVKITRNRHGMSVGNYGLNRTALRTPAYGGTTQLKYYFSGVNCAEIFSILTKHPIFTAGRFRYPPADWPCAS